MDIKEMVSETSLKLLAGHSDFTKNGSFTVYPNVRVITGILNKIRMVISPGYFNEAGRQNSRQDVQGLVVGAIITDIYLELTNEIETAFLMQKENTKASGTAIPASEISAKLIEKLADIQQLLYKDAEAGFDGDPAAKSKDEIILTYPGFFAVFVYRIAHILFSWNVPFIPRIMSEHAHSITGIDIHPGAEIGEYFFIDHGTGVVIGETTVIGNHVKLYQGVTLGALSTKKGQSLAGLKRHPTIEDNVTVYAGATILGGETVIGRNSVIGGNMFVTESLPPGTTLRSALTTKQ